MKQIPLEQFIAEYGMPRSSVLALINRRDNPLPAYKISGRWYVAMDKYEKWREAEHKRSYKYAQ